MVKNKTIWTVLNFIVIVAVAFGESATPAAATESLKDSAVAKAVVVKWYDSYKTATEISKLENKPMLIDFTAMWCGWCEMLDKEVFSHQEIAAKLQKFICVRIDVDKDRQTAYGFSVTSLPRIIVINTHSEIVGDWLGYRGREDFSELLDDVMEYAKTKTGAMEAPEIASLDQKQVGPVKTVMLDLSNRQAVIEQLASKEPAVRQAVIERLAADPTEAMAIAAAGLESKYLGERIASWELMKKINRTTIDFDPWASAKRRIELLKPLKTSFKPAEKPTKKLVEKPAELSTEKPAEK
ncbi:MAG: thioredoxin family protein [Phycisphaerae bacterium]|nr:thioredoxin family protein [Phycisphaerae bacterium]